MMYSYEISNNWCGTAIIMDRRMVKLEDDEYERNNGTGTWEKDECAPPCRNPSGRCAMPANLIQFVLTLQKAGSDSEVGV